MLLTVRNSDLTNEGWSAPADGVEAPRYRIMSGPFASYWVSKYSEDECNAFWWDNESGWRVPSDVQTKISDAISDCIATTTGGKVPGVYTMGPWTALTRTPLNSTLVDSDVNKAISDQLLPHCSVIVREFFGPNKTEAMTEWLEAAASWDVVRAVCVHPYSFTGGDPPNTWIAMSDWRALMQVAATADACQLWQESSAVDPATPNMFQTNDRWRYNRVALEEFGWEKRSDVQHYSDLRNTLANAAVDSVDAAATPGYMEIRAAEGTVLATITLNDPAFGAASLGVATGDVSPVPSDTSMDAAGTADHFIVYDGDGVQLWGGTCGVPGSGADMVLGDLSLSTSDGVRLTSLVYTAPA